MRRRLAAAAIVFAAFVFLHLPVEDAFDWMAGRFGFETYDRVAFWTFLTAGILLLAAAWLWPSRRRALIGSSMTALLVLMAVAQGLLVVVSIENIHYPQYALLLWALARALPSVESAWLITVGLGIVDEGYQFVAQTRGTPGYFDWNDVVLNAIGACLGVVVTLALTSAVPRARLRARTAVVVAAGLIAIAFVLDPPVLSPFFSFTPGGRAFHRVSATEAAVVVAALWAGVRASLSAPNLPAT